MLIEPNVFLNHAYRVGCVKNDFIDCAHNVTNRMHDINSILATGVNVYFALDSHRGLLMVTINRREVVESIPMQCSDLFDIIKLLAH